MNFHKTITDNPDAGERAMELVYEALTGLCWHRQEVRLLRDTSDSIQCPKCKDEHSVRHLLINPRLLESLDAWGPLWEIIKKDASLMGPYDRFFITNSIRPQCFAKPHHHLEAALRTLEVECPDCGGERYGKCKKGIPVIRRHPTRPCANDNICQKPCIVTCTCTKGKRTLWDIWKENSKHDKG